MENMWNLNLIEIPILIPPEKILEDQCEFLKEVTGGKVIAKVSPYSGPTENYSYIKKSFFDVFNDVFKSLGTKSQSANNERITVNIQEDLGNIGDVPNMYFAYEFFITSPSTPNYKFRIMFLTYTAGQYPIGIVLDNEIAIELNSLQNIVCENEDNFKNTVKNIINSNKVKKVINTLNSIAINMENKKYYHINTNNYHINNN